MKSKKLFLIKEAWILAIKKFIAEEKFTPKHQRVWLLYFFVTYIVYRFIENFYPELSIVRLLIFNLFLIWVYFLLKVISLS